MKILITGGLGYLGGHLTEWFCRREGWEVVVLARRSVMRQSSGRFRIIEADITDAEALRRKIDEPFDYCIHAASANDSFVPGYPDTALRVNAGGTRNLLEALQGRGLKRLVYLSTIHVYGTNSGRINEATPPAPINDYALTHRFAEQYVQMFHRRHALPFVILRLSNVYGAPCHIDSSKWYLVLNDLARMAHDRKEIVLKSNGRARRDFIWVGDVCRIIEGVLSSPQAGEQTLNVGAERTRAVLELAHMVKDAYEKRYGLSMNIRVNEEDQTAYPQSHLDCSRLRGIVGGEILDRFQEEINKIFDLLEAEPSADMRN